MRQLYQWGWCVWGGCITTALHTALSWLCQDTLCWLQLSISITKLSNLDPHRYCTTISCAWTEDFPTNLVPHRSVCWALSSTPCTHMMAHTWWGWVSIEGRDPAAVCFVLLSWHQQNQRTPPDNSMKRGWRRSPPSSSWGAQSYEDLGWAANTVKKTSCFLKALTDWRRSCWCPSAEGLRGILAAWPPIGTLCSG